jgi:hypothetical protein
MYESFSSIEQALLEHPQIRIYKTVIITTTTIATKMENHEGK